MRLAGKVALITGGGSGIGRATAVLFAREGARVAIVDRDADAATDLAATIGPDALARVSDVAEPGAAEADVAATLARWGRLDVLVTAAGFSVGGTVLTTAPADWDAVFRVHVGGSWTYARAAIPAMRKVGAGSIVLVSSQLALAGGRNNASYVAAKGAVLALARTMALDHAAEGIRVNAVLPGAIDTPLLRRSFARQADPEATAAASRARHPLGRFGRAEEVADAILYLAGDAAGFTTGVSLPVDGGWLAA